MADRNRRDDDDPVDDLDEVYDDDAVDDDADDDDEPVSRGGTATRARPKTEAADRPKAKKERRVGIFGRLARFVREVVAELRKVIWPTRKELLTYTAVVVVFVAFMLAIVAALDFGFAKAVLFVFGN